MIVGIFPNVNSIKTESGCRFGDKCSFAHRHVEGQPSKKPEKDGDKSAVAILKDARQLVCLFQDTEPPESLLILRKSPKVLGSIRRVRLTKAAPRHANIREGGELCTDRCPWSIDRLFKLRYTCISNISIAGSRASCINKK